MNEPLTDHSYVGWLTDFNDVLMKSRCRLNVKDADLEVGFNAIAALLTDLRARNGALWWVGNGGSSAICSHLSQDALNKLSIRSSVLSDASLMTCMANDYGYAHIYSKPLEKMAQKGDMLIAISSSGRSENILNCVRFANENGLKLVTLSAFDEGNPLWHSEADVSLYLPTKLYGHAEVGHEALLHAVLETLYLRENHP